MNLNLDNYLLDLPVVIKPTVEATYSYYSRHFNLVCELFDRYNELYAFTHQPSGDRYLIRKQDVPKTLQLLKDKYYGIRLTKHIPVYEED